MYTSSAAPNKYFRDQLYTAKPPLKFWLTTPLMAMFGETEFAARFWSAFSGVVVTIVLFFWGLRWKRSAWFAATAALSFALGQFIFFHSFRTGETDGLLTMWVTLALFVYATIRSQPRKWLLFGIFVGLGILTKFVAGLIPVFIVLLELAITKKFAQQSWKWIGYSVLAALAIAVPWHVAELVRLGHTFWDSYFGFHVLGRTERNLYDNNVPWYWYWTVVQLRTFPFFPLVVAGLCTGIYRAARRHAPELLLVLWVIVVFLLFTVVKTKFDWYIVPLYPALALLTASFLYSLTKTAQRWPVFAVVAVLWGWTLWKIPGGLEQSGNLWLLTPYALFTRLDATLPLHRLTVIFCTLLFLAALFWFARHLLQKRVAFTIALALFCYCGLLSFGLDVSALRHPKKSPFIPIGAVLSRRHATQLHIVNVDMLHQPAGYFYLRRVSGMSVTELKNPPVPEQAYILTTLADVDALQHNRDVLLQQGAYVLLSATRP